MAGNRLNVWFAGSTMMPSARGREAIRLTGLSAASHNRRQPVAHGSAMIRIAQITMRFGPHRALDGVSFDVARGEIAGVVGPNGAGKTTLLRILACYLPPTAGSACVAGLDVVADSLEVRRITGYLPESAPLYTDLRVGEFLQFRARIKGLGSAERRKRIRHVTGRCDLAGLERARLDRLSRGEARRVLLADALLHNPEVLLLDEPTVGMDPDHARRLRELIAGLGGEHTVVLATCNEGETRGVCRRVLRLKAGRLAEGAAGGGPA
jgi:ABC-2 type transport system ATP-binding protein